jgi:hypothetical protein
MVDTEIMEIGRDQPEVELAVEEGIGQVVVIGRE